MFTNDVENLDQFQDKTIKDFDTKAEELNTLVNAAEKDLNV